MLHNENPKTGKLREFGEEKGIFVGRRKSISHKHFGHSLKVREPLLP
jgi:hypothetical protein